jgi:hypothetical protein
MDACRVLGMDENDMPEDNLDDLEFEGMTPLDQDAANMHEMFESLQRAGFTERQALQLVAFLVEESGNGGAQIQFMADPNMFPDDEDDEE